MYTKEVITSLESIPIQSSYVAEIHLWALVLFHAITWVCESSPPARARERMGLRLASSWVNVTPHLWAWPAATACFPHRMMRRELWFLCRWDERRTQTLPQPALHCYHLCPRHFYLCLIEYYIKLSLSTATCIPFIHEDINNRFPPVLASVALFVDTAGLLKGAMALWFVVLVSHLSFRADVHVKVP